MSIFLITGTWGNFTLKTPLKKSELYIENITRDSLERELN